MVKTTFRPLFTSSRGDGGDKDPEVSGSRVKLWMLMNPRKARLNPSMYASFDDDYLLV